MKSWAQGLDGRGDRLRGDAPAFGQCSPLMDASPCLLSFDLFFLPSALSVAGIFFLFFNCCFSNLILQCGCFGYESGVRVSLCICDWRPGPLLVLRWIYEGSGET